MEKKIVVVSALAEGASIRGVERMTGVNQNTIMSLGLRVGTACAAIMDTKMRDLPCHRIEVDEIWGFIGAKKKNVTAAHEGMNYGDIWTWIALDPDSKVIPSFLVGQRDMYHARAFIDDLASRLKYRVQLSSDALESYGGAVERGFGSNVDYGQIVKTYSVTHLTNEAAGRYSPAEVVKTERQVIQGAPDISLISTSHVEKQNHTLRMHCRRLSRLTNAFSKKLDNFKAAVALNFCYYNFCKAHGAHKMTPAMAAGIERDYWTVEELVERCGES
jgi:IS1 family transposase